MDQRDLWIVNRFSSYHDLYILLSSVWIFKINAAIEILAEI